MHRMPSEHDLPSRVKAPAQLFSSSASYPPPIPFLDEPPFPPNRELERDKAGLDFALSLYEVDILPGVEASEARPKTNDNEGCTAILSYGVSLERALPGRL
jgi:hypothetical protein